MKRCFVANRLLRSRAEAGRLLRCPDAPWWPDLATARIRSAPHAWTGLRPWWDVLEANARAWGIARVVTDSGQLIVTVPTEETRDSIMARLTADGVPPTAVRFSVVGRAEPVGF